MMNVREAGSRNRNKRMVNATNQLDPDLSVIRPDPEPQLLPEDDEEQEECEERWAAGTGTGL